MTLETQERNSIILNAVAMTGPVGDDIALWEAQLASNAMRLTTLLEPGSSVAKRIDMLGAAKKFVGTVLLVAKEPTSKRGFVVLKTTPTKLSPDGIETVRTEIADWEGKEGEAFAFAKQVRGLVGHRVLVYIEMQTAKDDPSRKFRTLQHVVDYGPDTSVTEADYDAAQARAEKDMRK